MIDEILKTATKEIGTKAKPDCICKYTEEYGLYDQWCVIFVWWVFKHTNLSQLFYDGKKVASCTALYNWANPRGYVVKNPQRGDLVIFQFGKSRHIGICESVGSNTVTTIDGNTCLAGNEAQGGEVMRKTRYKSTVFAYIRPQYDEVVSKPSYYIVQSGDYLSKIANKFNTTTDELIRLNPQIKNPNIIYRGQKIRIK